jgi:hypothetical protein
MRRLLVAGTILGSLMLAGCGASADDDSGSSGATGAHENSSPAAGHADADSSGHGGSTAEVVGLAERDGEQIVTLALPGGSYTPEAPAGGTDDYRCFVLDLPADSPGGYATGFQVLPGNTDVTHHAILYRVYPEQVARAEELDAADPRPGYECFGGSGVPPRGSTVSTALSESDWITAWAPGGDAADTPDGYGVEIPAGGKVVLQMHYNTLGGEGPDDTEVDLRLAPADSGLKPLSSVLMPAPVEVPCPEGQDGPLCDRDAAIDDVAARFGERSAWQVSGLQLLCGGDPSAPVAGLTQSCTRPVTEATTLFAVFGHMHLLGKSITVDVTDAAGQSTRVLDVPQYDFDNQNAVPLAEPLALQVGDEVTVTCTHDPTLRGKVPGIPEEPRYVVWGEGTADEMCLGVLMTGKDA